MIRESAYNLPDLLRNIKLTTHYTSNDVGICFYNCDSRVVSKCLTTLIVSMWWVCPHSFRSIVEYIWLNGASPNNSKRRSSRLPSAHNIICDNEDSQVSVVKLETTTQSRLSFCGQTIKYSSSVQTIYMSDVLRHWMSINPTAMWQGPAIGKLQLGT